MKFSESPIITFVRGITLLATLIAVPGIAIFWNHLPKDFANKSTPMPQKVEETQNFLKDTGESAYPSLWATQPEPALSLSAPPVSSDAAIRQVSWEQPTEIPQDFEALILRLKALGVTNYCLQHWGNQGELFRFSCFVTPSESYSYERHFQAIDTDAVKVMRSVIAEIEQWKKAK